MAHDPENTMFIPSYRIAAFLKDLPEPMGLPKAAAGAQRRNHSREARRVRRASDLEPVQSRCGHTRRGSSRRATVGRGAPAAPARGCV